MLKSEIVIADNLSQYMSSLMNEEIYGCLSGRYTVIGIRDDEQDYPIGICVVEILPEYIRLHRVVVNVHKDKKTVLSMVLEILESMIENSSLPVYTFAIKANNYMKKMGFAEEKCDYTYKIGKLSDMKNFSMSKKPDMSIFEAEAVPKEELIPYIYHMSADGIVQFPYSDFDMSIFSSSLVCKTRNVITGLVLIEECDLYIKIPKIYFKNLESLDACFFVLRKMLINDYSSNKQIIFINSPRDRRDIPDRYFKKIKEVPLKLFKLV